MIQVNRKTVELSRFPDGTLHLIPEIDMSNADYHVTISWYYENDSEMAALMFLTKHFKENGFEVILFMPYIPNARMDRVKNENDVFTLKYFADFINSLHFSLVIVLDPHSSVSEALINNIIVFTPIDYIEKAFERVNKETNGEIIAFYPDEGAMKRYSEIIDCPYAFGVKRRDWSTGKILGLDIIGDENYLRGKNVIIIDDISSKGGTFYHSAKKLKEVGVNKIFLYVTHCEKTILEGEVFTSGLINKVYTTNSIFTPAALELAKSKGLSDKIEVFELENESYVTD